MTNVVPVRTDGVIVLDGYTDEDIAAHLAGEDEETARRFGWWPRTSTEATVRHAFRFWAQNWESGGPTRAFAARDGTTGRLVGGCELRLQPDGSAQVSYWTAAGERRRGYATRALGLLLQYARSIGITRAEAEIATDNLPSCRVAEKAGFRPTGAFPDENGTSMIRYQASLASPEMAYGLG